MSPTVRESLVSFTTGASYSDEVVDFLTQHAVHASRISRAYDLTAFQCYGGYWELSPQSLKHVGVCSRI